MKIAIAQGTLGSRKRRIVIIPALVALVFVLLFSAAISIKQSMTTYAATPPDACFSFNVGTNTIEDYYEYEGDNPINPACTLDIDVPATIGGVPVNVIGSYAFENSNATRISLPPSITSIQDNAFSGLTLSELLIDSAGDLDTWHSSLSGVTITSDDFSISAGGNLSTYFTLTGATFTGVLSLNAGGDISVSDAAFAGTTTGAVELTAGGNVSIANGAFSSAYTDKLSIEAGGNVTIQHGPFTAIYNGIDIQADGTITLSDGSFNFGMEFGGDLTLNAGQNVVIDSATSNVHFENVVINAYNDITLSATAFNSNPNLQSMQLISQVGEAIIHNGSLVGDISNLEQLTVDAPTGITIEYAFYNPSPTIDISLVTDGDVHLGYSAFNNGELQSIDIDTQGSIVVDGSAFGGVGYIHDISWQAGGDIYIDDALTNWKFSQTESVLLRAGGDLTLGDNVLRNGHALTSLTLQAGGSATFSAYTLQHVKVPVVSLPAGTVSIGDDAFSYGSIEEVYLNGSMPILGLGVFSFSGIDSQYFTGYSMLDQVHYVQLYTDAMGLNSAQYIDTVHGNYDLDGDDVDDVAGGYIVNPAHYSVFYRSSLDGVEIAPSVQNITGPQLSDYRVSNNSGNDFSVYYRFGDAVSLEPVVIATYTLPATQNPTLGLGANIYTFYYDGVGVPNTGFKSQQASDVVFVAAAMLTTVFVAVSTFVILRSKSKIL